MNILVLDPDSYRQRQLRLVLGSLGHKPSDIVTVADPTDAVRLVRSATVGCCFCTLHRPHLDPLPTVEEVRSTGTHKELPIIVVGVNAVRGDVVAATRAGATQFLTYPFTARNVQAVLRSALSR